MMEWKDRDLIPEVKRICLALEPIANHEACCLEHLVIALGITLCRLALSVDDAATGTIRGHGDPWARDGVLHLAATLDTVVDASAIESLYLHGAAIYALMHRLIEGDPMSRCRRRGMEEEGE